LAQIKKSLFKTAKSSVPRKKQRLNRFELIHNSFSSKKVSRQFPLLAGFHNAVDGALVGVIISVALMSSLALHWRHLWTIAFTRLETTNDLSHRFIDSTAMLERNLLESKINPVTMVPTKAENLLYLDTPMWGVKSNNNKEMIQNIIRNMSYLPVKKGY
tara:strand:+ start:50 stop:526 length:477 start_codon:yes stop_codon:yes gene_type:complete